MKEHDFWIAGGTLTTFFGIASQSIDVVKHMGSDIMTYLVGIPTAIYTCVRIWDYVRKWRKEDKE